MINLYKRYYFIGIGGIGMSALAEYILFNKKEVFGCDSSIERDIIYNLQKKEIRITNEDNLYKILEKISPDVFIVTNTVYNDHPAIIFAKSNNIKILKRSDLLGEITKNKNLIAVTGAHGKTSTVGLISNIFINEKKNPTVFIGGIMPLINNNFIIGNSDTFIVEADDAYKSFLSLNPTISVVTNISYEHLETYKDLEDIKETFLNFVENTKKNGFIIVNTDDECMINWAKKINNRTLITYGLNQYKQNISAINIKLNEFNSNYTLCIDGIEQLDVTLSIPGIHQIKNSLAAIAAAYLNGISIENSVKNLNNYLGVERRFQFVGYFNKSKIYDDYGHHPNELNATFETFCNAHKENKKIVFFQPHKYTRTKFLWNDFIDVFSKYKDKIEKYYITDVYDVGECFDKDYNSITLINHLNSININAQYVPFEKDFNSLKNEAIKIKNNLNENDAILCLGAGLLDDFAKKIQNY